jgi:peptide-methionine (R)-S-oxide reductase
MRPDIDCCAKGGVNMKRMFTAMLMGLLVLAVVIGVNWQQAADAAERVSAKIRLYSVAAKGYIMSDKVVKSEAEWRKQLTGEQYHVTREKGTEQAYTGATWNNHEKGIYKCIGCGNDLFSSEHKYESGTGWPSFWQPVASENVAVRPDNTFFMKRTEVICSRCNAHLGHVFDDGPKPTGLRYCMNSAAMKFVKAP